MQRVTTLTVSDKELQIMERVFKDWLREWSYLKGTSPVVVEEIHRVYVDIKSVRAGVA